MRLGQGCDLRSKEHTPLDAFQALGHPFPEAPSAATEGILKMLRANPISQVMSVISTERPPH